jgi:leader peptidase (prepilin peptidase) / N-methyltransferase
MIILIGIVVLNIGLSFLINLLSDNLPNPNSKFLPICVSCKSKLAWTKYLFFLKCDSCGRNRTFRHFIVLIIMALSPIILYYFPPSRTGWLIGLLLLDYFLLVFIIDLEHRLIFYSLTIIGAVICLPIGVIIRLQNIGSSGSISLAIFWTLLGCLAGFLIMLGLYFLGRLFSAVIAKMKKQEIEKEALGYGDVLISAIIGLLFGWPGILAVLVGAIILGGLVSLSIILIQLIRKKYQPFSAIPYAPFLIVCALGILYFAH